MLRYVMLRCVMITIMNTITINPMVRSCLGFVGKMSIDIIVWDNFVSETLPCQDIAHTKMKKILSA